MQKGVFYYLQVIYIGSCWKHLIQHLQVTSPLDNSQRFNTIWPINYRGYQVGVLGLSCYWYTWLGSCSLQVLSHLFYSISIWNLILVSPIRRLWRIGMLHDVELDVWSIWKGIVNRLRLFKLAIGWQIWSAGHLLIFISKGLTRDAVAAIISNHIYDQRRSTGRLKSASLPNLSLLLAFRHT